MSRCLLFLLSTLVVSMMSVGCCGPGCGVVSCNDCDGIGYGEQVIPQRPLGRLRNGSLFCGSGCGEVYIDEWASNPPDCRDPCSGADWVGGSCGSGSCGGGSCGGSGCVASCWQPGDLLRRFGFALLGGRNCSGVESSAGCGCSSCGGGGLLNRSRLLNGGGLLGGRICSGVESSASCGCSSGSCGGSVIEHSSPIGYSVGVPATSSCGCSSASATPVGTSVYSANRLAPPKRDGLTKHR